jgi:hypothetical protein
MFIHHDSFHCKDAKVVPHTLISKCNRAYKQNHGQKNDTMSIYVEKTFDKIQHPFMIKFLKKLGTEGMNVPQFLKGCI